MNDKRVTIIIMHSKLLHQIIESFYSANFEYRMTQNGLISFQTG